MSARYQSVIVYGPQGCGKTVNAAKLQRKLGLSQVLDLGLDCTEHRLDRGPGKVPHQDTLILTSHTREELLRAGHRNILSFAAVMDAIQRGTPTSVLMARAGA